MLGHQVYAIFKERKIRLPCKCRLLPLIWRSLFLMFFVLVVQLLSRYSLCIGGSVFVDVKRCFSLFLDIYEVLFHLRFSGFVAVIVQQRVFFFFGVWCFYSGVFWRELCKYYVK
jgi:hypothetical protein